MYLKVPQILNIKQKWKQMIKQQYTLIKSTKVFNWPIKGYSYLWMSMIMALPTMTIPKQKSNENRNLDSSKEDYQERSQTQIVKGRLQWTPVATSAWQTMRVRTQAVQNPLILK